MAALADCIISEIILALLDAEPRWAAQWMWLHPYYRGKGIMSSA
jgi:RimJ/RimL family protein N-acetyltransferase